jgi:hypothetical protein
MGPAPLYADPNQDPERDSIDAIGVGQEPYIPFELTRRSAAPAPASGVALRTTEHPPEFTDSDSYPIVSTPLPQSRRRAALLSQDPESAPDESAAPRVDHLAETLAAVRTATNRDAVFKLLLEGMRPVAPRVAVFAVKRGVLMGWTCSPEMADVATFKGTQITPPPESVLLYALLAEDVVVTSIPDDASHAPLRRAIRAPFAGDVAVVTVRVDKKPVALVLADGWSDVVRASSCMQQVASATGDALARLLREQRK